jgi:hypothetical protein
LLSFPEGIIARFWQALQLARYCILRLEAMKNYDICAPNSRFGQSSLAGGILVEIFDDWLVLDV